MKTKKTLISVFFALLLAGCANSLTPSFLEEKADKDVQKEESPLTFAYMYTQKGASGYTSKRGEKHMMHRKKYAKEVLKELDKDIIKIIKAKGYKYAGEFHSTAQMSEAQKENIDVLIEVEVHGNFASKISKDEKTASLRILEGEYYADKMDINVVLVEPKSAVILHKKKHKIHKQIPSKKWKLQREKEFNIISTNGDKALLEIIKISYAKGLEIVKNELKSEKINKYKLVIKHLKKGFEKNK